MTQTKTAPMTEQHPITPPPELVQQWAVEYWGNPGGSIGEGRKYIATQAARWGADQQLQLDAEQINQAWQKGADQELNACCAWLEKGPYGFSIVATAPSMTKQLRAARRPKPPSSKEQTLNDFDLLMSELDSAGNYSNCAKRIRRVLEALPE